MAACTSQGKQRSLPLTLAMTASGVSEVGPYFPAGVPPPAKASQSWGGRVWTNKHNNILKAFVTRMWSRRGLMVQCTTGM